MFSLFSGHIYTPFLRKLKNTSYIYIQEKVSISFFFMQISSKKLKIIHFVYTFAYFAIFIYALYTYIKIVNICKQIRLPLFFQFFPILNLFSITRRGRHEYKKLKRLDDKVILEFEFS